MEHILTAIYVFWPQQEPPSPTDAERLLGAPAPGAGFCPDRDPLWTRGWKLAQGRWFGAWAGYVDDLPSGVGLMVQARSSMLARRARRARFHLGLLTWLDAKTPLRAYQDVLRTCLRLCPDPLAVVDPTQARARDGDETRALAEAPTPPDVIELYQIEAIPPDPAAEGFWVHTHGLERAGFPDVEILDVPPPLVGAAGRLVRRFVGRYFGKQLPGAGNRLDLGSVDELTWLPLEEILQARKSGAPGGPGEGRRGSHGGWRVGLVGRSGRRPSARQPPLEALGALEHVCPLCEAAGEAHGEEEAQRARTTWTRFVRLFVDHAGSPAWRFLVRLRPKEDGPEDAGGGGEDGTWHVVDSVRKARLRSRAWDGSGDGAGPARWYAVDRLLDWQVLAPWGLITPRTGDSDGP